MANREWFPSLRAWLFLGLLGACGLSWTLMGSTAERNSLRTSTSDTISAWQEKDQIGWHRAVLNTLIRQGESLKSNLVQTLPMGRFVHVLKRHGRRVKIDFPARGWTSITTVKGEPILMWDAPEAEHKNIWSLTRDQRAAVLESREILKKNQKKEKQAQHDKLLRRGITSLVRRYQSGALQESLEKRFSLENIKNIEGQLEQGIEQVGNATQQVLKVLSRNETSIKGITDALNDTGLLKDLKDAAKVSADEPSKIRQSGI
eukprot:symbB.v1.2.030669.t1/scaffold3433.1/size56802/3